MRGHLRIGIVTAVALLPFLEIDFAEIAVKRDDLIKQGEEKLKSFIEREKSERINLREDQN